MAERAAVTVPAGLAAAAPEVLYERVERLAADLARVRAERDRLAEALRPFAACVSDEGAWDWEGTCDADWRAARAALEEVEGERAERPAVMHAKRVDLPPLTDLNEDLNQGAEPCATCDGLRRVTYERRPIPADPRYLGDSDSDPCPDCAQPEEESDAD